VGAASLRVTAIGSAIVTITAIGEFTALARTQTTLVPDGARVAILAGSIVQVMNAAGIGIADIGRTLVPVSAKHVVSHEETTGLADAGIRRTVHLVVADKSLTANTLTAPTLVIQRAWVFVVTGCGVEFVHTAQLSNTLIICAEISIVTNQLLCPNAVSLLAMVARRAQRAIATETLTRFVDAAGILVAGIVSAWLPVIAIHELPGAPAVAALVTGGARVTVVARCIVQSMRAAHLGVARVVGARVAITAVEGA